MTLTCYVWNWTYTICHFFFNIRIISLSSLNLLPITCLIRWKQSIFEHFSLFIFSLLSYLPRKSKIISQQVENRLKFKLLKNRQIRFPFALMRPSNTSLKEIKCLGLPILHTGGSISPTNVQSNSEKLIEQKGAVLFCFLLLFIFII